jgi:hypothetical protein
MSLKYVFSVEKKAELGKKWVKYYAPELASNSVHDIFNSKNFMNKYSKSPDPEKSLKDIKEEAKANASEYTDKVKERIRSLNLNKGDILVTKVSKELPTSRDLVDILISYRMFKTEGRSRIRRPTSIQLKEQSATSRVVSNKPKKKHAKVQ